MPKSLTTAVLLLLATVQYVPSLAQPYRSTEIVEVKGGVRFEYKQRLRDLQDQINKGVDKGWINADQGAALSAEHDRLLGATNKVKKAGWPKDMVDKLEKDVTAFSAKVSSTLSKGTTAPPATGSASK
jgi:hypothetical protein